MNEKKIFFSNDGLTSTSANHIANLAKEAYTALETELESVSFINKYVELMNSEKKQIRQGATEDEVKKYKLILEEIAQYKSLIAWLREAIKAKESLQETISDMSTDEIAKLLNITFPEEPEMEKVMTEDDYWAKQNVKQRNRFYHLDTLCAVYGQFIHPRRPFANARVSMYKELKNPCEVRDSGVNLTIYTIENSVDSKVIEDVCFDLQKTYREYQAQLNSMKHDAQLAVEQDYYEKHEKYQNALSEYHQVRKELVEKCNAYRKSLSEEVSRMKIVIPDDLKAIFQKVNSLGK